MRTPYQIPLSPKAQAFTIQLNGVIYNMDIKWNSVAGCWVLDIADAANAPLVSGVPVITGRDLLEQYPDLGFGGALIAQTDNNPDAVPTYANLGSTGKLYFVVEG